MLLIDKTLLRSSKGMWRWIFAIVAVRTAGLIASTYFALIVAGFLGDMFHPDMHYAEMTSAIKAALLAAVVMFLVQLLQGELEFRCTAQARTNLRAKIFAKVLELDVGNIEKIGPVSAITSSVDAVEQMQTYYSSYLPSLIYSVIAPLYIFFKLKDISLFTAVLLLVIAVLLLPVNNLFRAKIEKLRRIYWRSVDDMTGTYLDGIRGLTTLKLFGRDRDHSAMLSEKAENLNKDINKFMKVNFTSFLVTEGMIYLSIVAALAVTCMRLRSGAITISAALTVLMLSYSFFSSMHQLMTATHAALMSVSAVTKVEDILKVDTSRKCDPDLPKDPENFDGIRLENVSFSYEGRQQALTDVSMTVPKGSVIALAGLSGCGKSTVASILMRFMDPGNGHIYIEGRDYESLRPEELRKKIIMVPQTVSMFSGSIRDNLLIADPSASDAQLMEALDRAELKTFVESLPDGLSSDVGDSGAKLSGGQKQKIGIARALLSNAEYIIFDEATSAVDTQSEQEIWKCIENLAGKRTLIIISHRLSTIHDSDIIYVLQSGRISESGNHEALMEKHGLYRQMVEEQEELERSAAV